MALSLVVPARRRDHRRDHLQLPRHRQADGRRRLSQRDMPLVQTCAHDLLLRLSDPGDDGRHLRHPRQPAAAAPLKEGSFMETSTTSTVASARGFAGAGSAGTPRRACCRWLGGFGRLGLLGLAVLRVLAARGAARPRGCSRHGTAAVGTSNVFEPISAAHWLGTDYLGRDMLALIIEGARYHDRRRAAGHAAGQRNRHRAGAAGRRQRPLDRRGAEPWPGHARPPSRARCSRSSWWRASASSVPMLVDHRGHHLCAGAYRMARSLAVNINALDYVTVARTRGEGTLYIMLREILPNILGPMLADLGLRFVYGAAAGEPELPGPGHPAAGGRTGARWCARTSARWPWAAPR